MKEVTKEEILDIINNAIEGDAIDLEQLDDDLSELGMDSIKFIQIIVEIEETFECEIPDSKLIITELNTVQKIFDVLQELHESQTVHNTM